MAHVAATSPTQPLEKAEGAKPKPPALRPPLPNYLSAESSKCIFSSFIYLFLIYFSQKAVLCPVVACSYAELELCLAPSFGLITFCCNTRFVVANLPTEDHVSAPLSLLCPACPCWGMPPAFWVNCTLFWEVLRSSAFAGSPPSVSSVLDEFALCGVFLFIYCKQIWSLPFVYSYTLSLCLGMHF